MIDLEQLVRMSQAERFAVVQRAHPLDPEALADTRYTGVDLSMPAIFHRFFWRTFRKTFHLDPATGRLRGWNVKVVQGEHDGPPPPLRDRQGRPRTFGHYEVRSAVGVRFLRGWQGQHYLDYRVAGNRLLDWPARNGFCPLVAVNPGQNDLLLGWEIFNFGGLRVPVGDFWALRLEGPLPPEEVIPRPDGRAPAQLTQG